MEKNACLFTIITQIVFLPSYMYSFVSIRWIHKDFPAFLHLWGFLLLWALMILKEMSLEPFPHWWHKEFLSPVSFHMTPKRWMITEGFPTGRAFIGLLTSVYSPVDVKVGAYAEGFPTVITLIWLLSCVTPHVCLKGWLVSEGFPTLSTFNVFLYKMNTHVPPPG